MPKRPRLRLAMAALAIIASACGGGNPSAPSLEVRQAGSLPDADPGAEGSVAVLLDNRPPLAIFSTNPAADEYDIITGPAPLTVTFNLCRSSDPDPGDELKYLFDFDDNGVADFQGTCRATQGYAAPSRTTVCVSDRQPLPGHKVCQTYHINTVPPRGVSFANGALTTYFSSNGGACGNMFDVTASRRLEITGFDANLGLVGGGAGLSATLEVYYRVGTSVGAESSPAGWTLLGSDAVVSAGRDVPTRVNVGGLTLAPGQTYGLYLTVDSASCGFVGGSGPSMRYVTPSGPTTFASSELTIVGNVGKSAPPFTGTTFSPRDWSGTVYYRYRQ